VKVLKKRIQFFSDSRMNLPEKARLILPVFALLWVCSFMPASAQNWQEYHVLNQNSYLQFQRTFLFYSFLLQEPDPALGQVELETQGSLLTVTFTPTPGAVGTAEFIIEYFPDQFPLAPKVEAFRVFISTSYVTAGKDYVSVDENSSGNVLDVLSNDQSHHDPALALSLTHIAAAKNGTATINTTDQTIGFTPDAGFTGMAYVTYVVCDELGACEKAEVNICVVPQGDIPEQDTI
jgi:hypothetical protein